jgi:hypothetical protein
VDVREKSQAGACVSKPTRLPFKQEKPSAIKASMPVVTLLVVIILNYLGSCTCTGLMR